MTQKVLFVATVDYHFQCFHLPYLQWFKERGWEVHIAANGELKLPFVDVKINVPIQRSPLHKDNLKAYQKLKGIMDQNHYDIIHCHTPMGGVLARLAAGHSRKHGTKVIYTAHGFHFCTGAPIKNWMIYYPIEKWLARSTDCLVTINQEDFQLAKRKRFKVQHIDRVHGVGVDTQRFKPVSESRKQDLRSQYGYSSSDFLLFYAAEFNKNKNQQYLIRAMAMLRDEFPQVKLLLAGEGMLLKECRKLAMQLRVEDRIDFLGYRTDIDQILPMCDLAVASSLREGLPVNILEAMACRLPVIATDNRGHRELVRNNLNGWIVQPSDVQDMALKIKQLLSCPALISKFGKAGRRSTKNRYAIQRVLDEKSRIYSKYMKEMGEMKWAVR